jgi:hypothetical protein
MPRKKQTEPKQRTRQAMNEETLVEMCRRMNRMPGVTGTWLAVRSDQEADVYVTVLGVDETALHDQMVVYRAMESLTQSARPVMDSADFAFNYYVLADDDRIGDPLIPTGARQIA